MLIQNSPLPHEAIANMSLDNEYPSHLEPTFEEKAKSERRSVTLKRLSVMEELPKAVMQVQLPESARPKTSPSPAVNSASHIRSRFLNRLGISDITMVPTFTRSPSQMRLLNQNHSFREILKADHGKQDKVLKSKAFPNASKSADATAMPTTPCIKSVKTSRRNQVSFDSQVHIMPIPSRNAYSKRIRNTIWMPMDELEHNVARNTLEFIAENWDWRQVAEDEDMVYYEGEMVHPVHFVAPEYNVNRQFAAVMTAQQQSS
jgi:hypothetical protein